MSLPSSQLTLPGNFVIEIAYRSDKQIKQVMKVDCYGYWEQKMNGGKVVLNADVPMWRQIKTFGHELVHAVHDYAHWLDRHADNLKAEGEQTLRDLDDKD